MCNDKHRPSLKKCMSCTMQIAALGMNNTIIDYSFIPTNEKAVVIGRWQFRTMIGAGYLWMLHYIRKDEGCAKLLLLWPPKMRPSLLQPLLAPAEITSNVLPEEVPQHLQWVSRATGLGSARLYASKKPPGQPAGKVDRKNIFLPLFLYQSPGSSQKAERWDSGQIKWEASSQCCINKLWHLFPQDGH